MLCGIWTPNWNEEFARIKTPVREGALVPENPKMSHYFDARGMTLTRSE
jgi:hypothetical protein